MNIGSGMWNVRILCIMLLFGSRKVKSGEVKISVGLSIFRYDRVIV